MIVNHGDFNVLIPIGLSGIPPISADIYNAVGYPHKPKYILGFSIKAVIARIDSR